MVIICTISERNGLEFELLTRTRIQKSRYWTGLIFQLVALENRPRSGGELSGILKDRRRWVQPRQTEGTSF